MYAACCMFLFLCWRLEYILERWLVCFGGAFGAWFVELSSLCYCCGGLNVSSSLLALRAKARAINETSKMKWYRKQRDKHMLTEKMFQRGNVRYGLAETRKKTREERRQSLQDGMKKSCHQVHLLYRYRVIVIKHSKIYIIAKKRIARWNKQ